MADPETTTTSTTSAVTTDTTTLKITTTTTTSAATTILTKPTTGAASTPVAFSAVSAPSTLSASTTAKTTVKLSKTSKIIANLTTTTEKSLLDNIPDSTWFFCFPLSWGVYCITVLGIIHPLFWISVMRSYRSELFVFMYVLVGFWSFLSCALLYAIFAESSCIYVFWIWYTMAFGVAMIGMMFLLFCGFCVLGMRRKSLCALVGLVYYLVTLYFVLVVNKQRKEVFGLQAYDCGECAQNPGGRRYYQFIPDFTAPRLTTQPTTTALTLATAATEATAITTATMPKAPTMRTVATGPLAGDAFTTRSMTKRSYWVLDPHRGIINHEGPKTLPSTDLKRLVAIARLSDLLLNSEQCRKPRKPAHGRFQVSGLQSSTLRLTLRCNKGYRENSFSTECKNNWWDRPIPQCRKRREPAPPVHAGGCLMPKYPEHGDYTVTDHARVLPGDRVLGDNVILSVTCEEPYRPVDPYVICVEGRWRHAPPCCLRHCRLVFDPTVEYECYRAFDDAFLACSAWQPDGATVVASCRPGHAHRGPFRYMRCRGDAWDHVVSCLPNANFTK